jgi:biopolymer transport protein ExbD
MAMKGLGSSDSGDGDSSIMAEINITPLTDIFLVLLIIFMVTSSVMSNMGVDVSLPSASNATSQAQPEGIIVTLMPNGSAKVNDQPVAADSLDDITALLKAAFAKTTSRLVILEGDKQALLGSAIKVMDLSRQAGAEKFAIATSPENN